MEKLYLITGAAGHLGTVLVEQLLKQNERVRALALPGTKNHFDNAVEVCYGDITNADSLADFFQHDDDEYVILIHCAAVITIASKPNPRVWNTNVNGTRNVMDCARKTKIDRVVYVSSVHAIPPLPNSQTIKEVDHFSPDLVEGQYAKSKAAAAQLVLDDAQKGLNVSIVHPSGIIGPGDLNHGNQMIQTLQAMKNGKIRQAVQGGYDFVDSRDVANGILACAQKGRAGECYILNGHYVTILRLLNMVRKLSGKRPVTHAVPYWLVKIIAPLAERFSLMSGKRAPLLTPYSIATLHTNAHFSHQKATAEFGYQPRDIEESVRDSL